MKEYRTGTQVIAVMQAGRCVGKLYEIYSTWMGVEYQSWKGYVLDKEVHGRTQPELMATCRAVMKERGLKHCNLVADEDFPVIIPAFEE